MVAGLRVPRGSDSEATAPRPLVDTFVEVAGRGVMKVLLLDRGFINGPQIGRLTLEHGIPARPEQGAGADPDRALSGTDQLVGLCGSFDGCAFPGRVCRWP